MKPDSENDVLTGRSQTPYESDLEEGRLSRHSIESDALLQEGVMEKEFSRSSHSNRYENEIKHESEIQSLFVDADLEFDTAGHEDQNEQNVDAFFSDRAYSRMPDAQPKPHPKRKPAQRPSNAGSAAKLRPSLVRTELTPKAARVERGRQSANPAVPKQHPPVTPIQKPPMPPQAAPVSAVPYQEHMQAQSDHSARIAQLTEQKRISIANEDYERAAQLHHEIQALESGQPVAIAQPKRMIQPPVQPKVVYKAIPKAKPKPKPKAKVVPVQPNVIQAQPVMVGNYLGKASCRTCCPWCYADVQTAIEHECGTMTWIATLVLFCFCTFCFYIPLITDCCKDTVHKCPNCGRIIAVVPA